jgi:hypothetical protein
MVKTCAIALAVGLAIICGVAYEAEGFGGTRLICTGACAGSATCQSLRHGLLEGFKVCRIKVAIGNANQRASN